MQVSHSLPTSFGVAVRFDITFTHFLAVMMIPTALYLAGVVVILLGCGWFAWGMRKSSIPDADGIQRYAEVPLDNLEDFKAETSLTAELKAEAEEKALEDVKW